MAVVVRENGREKCFDLRPEKTAAGVYRVLKKYRQGSQGNQLLHALWRARNVVDYRIPVLRECAVLPVPPLLSDLPGKAIVPALRPYHAVLAGFYQCHNGCIYRAPMGDTRHFSFRVRYRPPSVGAVSGCCTLNSAPTITVYH